MQQLTIKSIKQVLASGQTEMALQQLMTFTEKASQETHQSAILLRAAWEYQEQQAISGALSFEEANLQRNRINQGALSLLADIESDGQISKKANTGLHNELYNNETAALMQTYDNDQTNLQGAKIHADDGASVIIGEGNTVHKKTYNALGIRQFGILLIALVVVIGGGYFVYKQLNKGQGQSIASLSDIQKELGVLADLNKNLSDKLEKDRPEIEALLEKGLKAMKEKDYATSIQYLEKVAESTPASTIYQNIAYAYEQLGKTDKAQENLSKAKGINPNIELQKSDKELKGKRINLLAPENGGKMVAATSDDVKKLTDGALKSSVYEGAFGIYSFKDGKAARFDHFEVYVPESAHGKLQFELFYGNDSPTGNFVSIGVFEPFNGLLTDSPFQQFTFPPVTAKYFKFKKSMAYSYEIRLMGTLE
ncbi:MAG: hypothetical protein ACKV1O_13500 [Saprospiraceae bacterium]